MTDTDEAAARIEHWISEHPSRAYAARFPVADVQAVLAEREQLLAEARHLAINQRHALVLCESIDDTADGIQAEIASRARHLRARAQNIREALDYAVVLAADETRVPQDGPHSHAQRPAGAETGNEAAAGTEGPQGAAEPVVHAEEIVAVGPRRGQTTGYALCDTGDGTFDGGPLAPSSWQVTCEKCLTGEAESDADDDGPTCRDCGTWPCARHATEADRAEYAQATGSDKDADAESGSAQ